MNKFKKVTMIFVALSSVSIITAWANQDVGVQLKNWYYDSLAKSQLSATDKFKDYSIANVKELEAERNKLSDQTSSRIAEGAVQVTKDSNDHIDMYNHTYTNKLQESHQIIKEKIDSDFNQYVDEKNAELKSYIDENSNFILSEIEKELNK